LGGGTAAKRKRVTGMSDEQGSEVSSGVTDPDGEVLRQELARNVEKPSEVPSGYQLQGPGEPGAAADVPGVLGGPGINIVSEDEDEPDNRWSEHPR
jgi:hypothetical protein